MKVRTIISALFAIVVTILYFFGKCELDIWVYILSMVCVVIYMVVFMRQQKIYNKLEEKKYILK